MNAETSFKKQLSWNLIHINSLIATDLHTKQKRVGEIIIIKE
jgi:hypothetical protein